MSKDFLLLVSLSFTVFVRLAWLAAAKLLDNYPYRINVIWPLFAAAGLPTVAIALVTVSFQSIHAALANPPRSLHTDQHPGRSIFSWPLNATRRLNDRHKDCGFSAGHTKKPSEPAMKESNTMKASNTIFETYRHGQSIWLDYIDRGLIRSGELEHMITDQGLTGMTSNPSIFEKSISGSDQYNEQIKDLIARGKGNEEIFYSLALDDVCAAADLFKKVFDRHMQPSGDGFVSIEVSPKLAKDTAGSIRQGELLWGLARRHNVMIKVPGTAEGIAAIQQLTSEGVNVNITLLFGLKRYEQVINAYLSGLETRVAAGQPINEIYSVASFFLSRVDVLLDPQLENKHLGDLKGKVAIALAKKAYAMYKQTFVTGGRSKALAAKGARPQRLLWASTSTKDPSYPDTKYVEALIGKDTIDTIPMETFHAFLDHGKVSDSLEAGLEEAEQILKKAEAGGFSMDQVAQELEEEGIQKFLKPYEKLMNSIEDKRKTS